MTVLSSSALFAFTPTKDLTQKIDLVGNQIEQLINQKWVGYRMMVVNVLNSLLQEQQGNDRNVYILETLLDHIEGDSDTTPSPSSSTVSIEGWFFGEYSIDDSVYKTNVDVTLTNTHREMWTNALPNHETGEFPNNGNPHEIESQENTFSIPLNPQWHGNAIQAQMPWVAINGINFEPETAEIVECDDGSSFRIEAFQDLANLGFDFNDAHVQPGGLYHYHGVPTELIEWADTGDDLVHIGFAADGYPIYYSKSNAYAPSYQLKSWTREVSSSADCTYRWANVANVDGIHDGTYVSDWEYDASAWDLDECNGTTVDGQYIYFITDGYPYITRCLNGTADSSFSKWWGGRQGWTPPSSGQPPHQHGWKPPHIHN